MQNIILALCLFLTSCTSQETFNYKLIEVVDGDSLVLESLETGEEEMTRLLGIDAPEYSQDPWGKRAREFILSEISPGDKLVVKTLREDRDKYGRLLAFVFYKEDDNLEFLNEEILEEGFAEIFVLSEWNAYNDDLKEAEAEAREEKKNIWSSDGIKMRPYEYRKKYMKQKVSR